MGRFNFNLSCKCFTYSFWFFEEKITNITKINGKYFCYKNISYIDLLKNGQIIKNGTECPKEYNKKCGKIDTLNQELCINVNEKCPLYDAGIGHQPDSTNYIYDKDSNVYYNNDNYNITNKTIIGRLILNEGQPCYKSAEKLWRQFSPIETDETHLTCANIQINGKGSDDRYIKKGEITYKKIYDENLNDRAKKIVYDNITSNETIYLYKRELYGLDKKCDEKFNVTNIFNNIVTFQSLDKVIQIIEGILIVACCCGIILSELITCGSGACGDISHIVYFWAFVLYIIVVSGCFSQVVLVIMLLHILIY